MMKNFMMKKRFVGCEWTIDMFTLYSFGVRIFFTGIILDMNKKHFVFFKKNIIMESHEEFSCSHKQQQKNVVCHNQFPCHGQSCGTVIYGRR